LVAASFVLMKVRLSRMILYSVAVVSHLSLCVFDVHLAVGTTRRPTKHGFSGIPVRFLSLMWERRASLEKTLSLSVHTCLYVRVRETGDCDLFLGPLEWARAETGGVDRWVL